MEHGETKWLGRLDSSLLREYEVFGSLSPTEYFERFNQINEILAEKYSTELIVIALSDSDPAINEFAQNLQMKYRRDGNSGRQKSFHVAAHDAKVLTYVLERRLNTDDNLWLVTLDGSLPGTVPEGAECASLSLNPRSVLQWLAPAVTSVTGGQSFPRIFSEMVQSRFLPR